MRIISNMSLVALAIGFWASATVIGSRFLPNTEGTLLWCRTNDLSLHRDYHLKCAPYFVKKRN